MIVPRPEYPRPQYVRSAWMNLNGAWEFEFDDDNRGLREKWFERHDFTRTIIVPYAFQSLLSGIQDTRFHDVVWYRRSFDVPEAWTGKRVLLHFGAVDYRAWVWVNGQFVTSHEGGHTPFYADVTGALQPTGNSVVVRVEDSSTDLAQPRGKQFWEEEPKSIFYTRTTGIWQTVWLEPVESSFIERARLTPNIDAWEIKVEYRVDNPLPNQTIEIEVSFAGEILAHDSSGVENLQFKATRVLPLPDVKDDRLWSPEAPNLYDMVLRLWDGNCLLDEVQLYFGMRKISVEEGRVLLNNRPYYMKLVLDQGYFPEGLITPPSDEDVRLDVEMTKNMGFNGVRKHQKIEDPRYLYWADRMGLLVWGEMANAQTYADCAVQRMMAEWQAAIERDYNHPCIVAWVPLNESWGVPRLVTDGRQPMHAMSLYYLTKSLDPTRLVISNDGWEHTKSDLCTIHDYESDPEVLRERYATAEHAVSDEPARRPIYVPGFHYQGEPIIISEFGGIACRKSSWAGWGYTVASSDDEFVESYRSIITTVMDMPVVQGFCYTQLADVEQEINGLLTYDRRPKVDPAIIRAINEGKVHKPVQGT
ncbi:MAG: glycoside hydrolase family 2 [Chloroflexi bacterium]|nr:glycoside hydrolase family 2 [Chloroflexota bacterium]